MQLLRPAFVRVLLWLRILRSTPMALLVEGVFFDIDSQALLELTR